MQTRKLRQQPTSGWAAAGWRARAAASPGDVASLIPCRSRYTSTTPTGASILSASACTTSAGGMRSPGTMALHSWGRNRHACYVTNTLEDNVIILACMCTALRISSSTAV